MPELVAKSCTVRKKEFVTGVLEYDDIHLGYLECCEGYWQTTCENPVGLDVDCPFLKSVACFQNR